MFELQTTEIRVSKDRALPRSGAINTVVSALAGLLGLIFIVVFAPQTGGWALVFSTIGTTLLTIGIVSFTSEHLLRRALTKDLLTKIGLQRRLHDAGLDGVEELTKSEALSAVFRGSRSNLVVMLRPSSLTNRIWPEVERACSETGGEFDIYLPNPDSPDFGNLCRRLNLDPTVGAQEVRTSFNYLQDRWDRARGREVFKPDSVMNLYLIDDDLGHSLVATDFAFVLVIEPFNPRGGQDEALALQFRRRDELAERALWLKESVIDLNSRKLTPDWSGSARTRSGSVGTT